MIVGIVLGLILGYFAFSYWGASMGNSWSSSEKEIDAMSEENEKLLKRTKEMQQEIDELVNKNSKLLRELNEIKDDSEEGNDELVSAKKKIQRLESRISDLEKDNKEWEKVCDELKSKLNM